MNILMSNLDYSLAPIVLREQLSFTKAQVGEIVRRIKAQPGIRGAVLLSTCNRTELYLSCEDSMEPEPWVLLCRAAGADPAHFADAFVTCRGQACICHLMEVACGMRSQIWGEDQILTQVKTAVTLAREAGATDSILETLFRTAASCGKAVKSNVHLVSRPTSAAHQAVEALAAHFGSLHGRRAVVIGNGEMGRLAAILLREAGCAVTVTLRTYRHGETVVPAGCAVAPYEDRYNAMEGADLLISATTSPHYTVSAEGLARVVQPPRALVDLAIPRDIQPEIGQQEGFLLLNMDALGHQAGTGTSPEQLAQANAIVEEHIHRFQRWDTYKESMTALEQVKRAATDRILSVLDRAMDQEETAEFAVHRALDLLVGGLSQGLDARSLTACAEKIRSHSR